MRLPGRGVGVARSGVGGGVARLPGLARTLSSMEWGCEATWACAHRLAQHTRGFPEAGSIP